PLCLRHVQTSNGVHVVARSCFGIEAGQPPIHALLVKARHLCGARHLEPAAHLVAPQRHHAAQPRLREALDQRRAVVVGFHVAALEPRVLIAREMPIVAVATIAGRFEQREQAFGVSRAGLLATVFRRAHAAGGRGTLPMRRSTSAASENRRSSAKAGPKSWRPTGNTGCESVAGVGAHGTLSPAMPARLAGNVNTSAKYMASGLSTFSPNRKAGEGLVGTAIASTASKAWSKS